MKHTEQASPVAVVKERVKELRKAKGLTAAELGEAMAAQGAPWDRSIVANFENGRRATLSVAELFALAIVLDVPPLLLMTPPEGRVLVAPDISLDAVGLVSWMDGTRGTTGLPTVWFRREAERLRRYRLVAESIAAAKAADAVANQARGTADETVADERREARLQDLARAVDPILRETAVTPAGMPLGWLTMLAARGWLDAELVPTDEAAALQASNGEEQDG